MTRRQPAVSVSILAAFLLAATFPAVHAQRRGSNLNAPGNVALSPDGALIAWTLGGREGTTLHVNSAPTNDPSTERLVAPNGATNCSNTAPVWSYDSQTLAFTSTCTGTTEEPAQEQLFLWSRKSGEVRQLTRVKGNLQQAAWSPDGHAIAFLFVENATRSAGALDAMKPWAGVIGEDNIEIQRVAVAPVNSLSARLTGGWTPGLRPFPLGQTPSVEMLPKPQSQAHLDNRPFEGQGKFMPIPTETAHNVIARASNPDTPRAGEPAPSFASAGYFPSPMDAQQITPASLHVYEFSWAPDSKQIAYIAAAPPGENNWWVAHIYTQRLQGAEAPHSILDPEHVSGPLHGLQVAVPRWAPDGKHISFIGGLMSDQGSTGGDVWVVDSKGGEPVDVTPGIDGTPTFADWISDHTVSFVEDRRGHTLLSAYNINSKTIVPGAPVDLGEMSVSGGPIKNAITYSDRIGDTKDRTAAFVMSGLGHAPDIWLATSGKLAQYSHMGDSVKSSTRTESVEWTNDGFHIQGWITYPANYDAKKKYPLIVTVHGGPSASSGPVGGGQWAQQGYFEFRPNPRGSFGQGETFTAANRKDFGYGDLQDILAGMTMLEAKLPIDKKREGLTGWSYGGFMSMFAATQTNRFAAIVAGAGISDWLSYYGENSIDQWMLPFFGGSVYDDPAVYAKSSAISYIKKAKTPMLILVGDRDGECPAPQSFEMWHALRDQGVKTQLVIYPNEGHGFRDPAHIRDRNERTAKWFAENMPAK